MIAIENARLLSELRQRTDDLTESLERQTATSNVLDVISRSAFDLQAVFKTVAESSVLLCGADRASIFRFDGELLPMVAAYNSPPEFKEWVARHPIGPVGTAVPHALPLNVGRSTFPTSVPILNTPTEQRTPKPYGQSLGYQSSKARNCWAS